MAKLAKRPKELAPVDDAVVIPSSVKAAAARSEEIFKAVYTDSEPLPPADPPSDPPADPPAEPVSAAPVEPAPPPAPTAQAPVPDQSWEHRYNSMKGRFDRADSLNRQLSERISGLEATMASMTAPPAPAPVEQQATRLLTPQEESDYGQEFLDVVGRRAKEQISPEVSQLRQQVEDLTKRLENVGGYVAQDARSRMHDTLNRDVPNWTEINDNEKFLDWLALPDPYSGVIRHQLLKSAYAANDAPRVLNFFKGFLAQEAAENPPAPTPDPQPAPPAPAPKVPLESLAAPGRAKTAAAMTPAEKPFFTRADVTKFYSEVASGKWAGRDEDKNRLERQIHEAGKDGRIRP